MTFKEQLVKLRACRASLIWVKNKTIEEAWATCENSDWMLWILTRIGLDLTDPLCDIAEGVLHLVPEEHRLVCSNAIISTRRRASKEELKDAASYASVAYAAAIDGTAYAASASVFVAVYAAARTIAYIADFDAATAGDEADVAYSAATAAFASADASYYAIRVAGDAAYVVFYSCAYNADAYSNEKKKQCDILRKYFTIDQVKEALNKLVA